MKTLNTKKLGRTLLAVGTGGGVIAVAYNVTDNKYATKEWSVTETI